MPDPREWEVAAEWFAYEHLDAIETRRPVKTKFAKQDFFGADVMARLVDGGLAWLQVTKGDRRAGWKKRKQVLPATYMDGERFLVLFARAEPDPKDGRRNIYLFDVQEHDPAAPRDATAKGWRMWPDPVTVPRKWFKTREGAKA